MSKSEKSAQKRQKFESHLISTFHERRILFEEKRLRFHATAILTVDDWGVSVRLEPETDREPFTVSGAWYVEDYLKNR